AHSACRSHRTQRWSCWCRCAGGACSLLVFLRVVWNGAGPFPYWDHRLVREGFAEVTLKRASSHGFQGGRQEPATGRGRAAAPATIVVTATLAVTSVRFRTGHPYDPSRPPMTGNGRWRSREGAVGPGSWGRA